MTVPTGRVLLAVDGNSLVHRAFHSQAGTGFRGPDGRPMWAVRGLVGQLLAAVERVDPDMVVVGFDDPDRNARQERWPHYKATRATKLATLVEQLACAVQVVAGLGIPVCMPDGLEADDVLASAARLAGQHGWTAVLMTSDRDAFALIDETTSVLRIINGGVEASPVLTPVRLRMMLGIGPDQYRDYAALRGDPSDNLPGVRGIGPKTAARLIGDLGSARAVFHDVDSGGAAVAAAAGATVLRALAEPAARERWAHNCAVMAQRDDLELAVRLDVLRPLAGAAVRDVFGRLGLPATLPIALRVLALEDAPEPTARPAAMSDGEPWTYWPAGPRQSLPPLPRKKPPAEQPALF
jgi:5'-3' exonuclease